MDEYEALARAAVAALQAANQPKWTDVLVAAGAVGSLGVGLLQCGHLYGVATDGRGCGGP